MIDITNIIDALFNVIIAIAAVALAYLKSKSDKDALIDAWVGIAVSAAEQAYKTGATNDRKAYAQKVLESKGFKVNWEQMDGMFDEIDTRLEAAVNQLPAFEAGSASSAKGVTVTTEGSQKGVRVDG